MVRYRRGLTWLTRRVLPALAVLALLGCALLLAGDAASGSNRLGRLYPWMLGFASLALLVLIAVIAVRLVRLFQDVRREVPGARLTRRLLAMLMVLALPPVVVVYGFAINFLNATVDAWFNVRLEQSLDDALEVGRLYIDERLRVTEEASARLATALADVPEGDTQAKLDEVIDALAATELTVFGDNATVIATASSDPRFLNPAYPDAATLMRLSGGGRYASAEPIGETLVLRVLARVGEASGKPRLLQALFPLPEKLRPLTQHIEAASFDFQRLKFLRGSLKLTFTLVLTFVLLLSVLFALLTAFGVARRLVAPIGRLAAATRAVGAGRYDTPLPVASHDELGFLLDSFNQMQRELERASARAQRSTQETEAQRAYLRTVLEHLSAGVLGIDRDGVLRTVNRAADSILGVALSRLQGQPLATVRAHQPELAPLIDPLLRHLRENAREWREEVVVERDNERRILLLHGTELVAGGADDAGYVAVFDDLTLLNRAQRDAAWAEVARRLAHEVKNPLTPIQLAAERLRRRFIGRLPVDDTDLMDRATRTIVNQVEALKAMVNSFGDYARPPQLSTRPLALHALVGEVLDLYENDQRLQLVRRFAAEELLVRADAGRLRQLLHNLMKNALEAIGETVKPRIEVSTSRVEEGDRAFAELTVADNGPGLPEGFDERWFEPYTSSKARGTGLGLAVVKKIVEEHGGSIRAEGREGGGASFRLRLPLD
ncbi:sensor histidine kinase [Tahibacter amnicola]|uniref:histidine kinase n=1 Tax=Tahibacter amnicola TaxID=2976241 RepID=A0ABY6BEW9_9GAMM|nr:ATP-binding protein [Tahibacter amnicola]UXI67813.1 ATP-binding protein [Tahibacter amnicola]